MNSPDCLRPVGCDCWCDGPFLLDFRPVRPPPGSTGWMKGSVKASRYLRGSYESGFEGRHSVLLRRRTPEVHPYSPQGGKPKTKTRKTVLYINGLILIVKKKALECHCKMCSERKKKEITFLVIVHFLQK